VPEVVKSLVVSVLEVQVEAALEEDLEDSLSKVLEHWVLEVAEDFHFLLSPVVVVVVQEATRQR